VERGEANFEQFSAASSVAALAAQGENTANKVLKLETDSGWSPVDVKSVVHTSWLVLRLVIPLFLFTMILYAFAYFITVNDSRSGFFGPSITPEILMIKAQSERLETIAAPDIAFFGDSSCLMDIDIPRLQSQLTAIRSMESYCTLAFLGPAGFKAQIDKMLSRGAVPRRLVLVFNWIGFDRHKDWDGWINYALNGPPALQAPSMGSVLDYMRRKWVDEAVYAPLPGTFGLYYGGASAFERTIRENHGSAIDPTHGLDITSLTDMRKSLVGYTPTFQRQPARATINEAFREAVKELALTVDRVGRDRIYLILTPLPDIIYFGSAVTGMAEAAQKIQDDLGLSHDHILQTGRAMEAPYFSGGTHLNRWGREVFTDEVAKVMRERFQERTASRRALPAAGEQ